MLRRPVNDAHEERPGVHIQAVYGLTVRAVWQFVPCCCVSTNWTSFFHLYFFSVITMSLFGLQVCSGNYQKITNTNAAAKKTANVQKQATTIFYNVIQITVY